MAIEFTAAVAEDGPAISRLLQAAFRAAEPVPSFDPAFLDWKYFNGSNARSYVLRDRGRLLAHGGLWPVGTARAWTLVDWAGAPETPGIGVMLVRHLTRLMASEGRALLSVSGSEETRQLMPKLGFAPRMPWVKMARIVRPWQQFRTRSGAATMREWARLGRNWSWSLAARSGVQGAPRVDVVRVETEAGWLTSCPGVAARRYRTGSDGEEHGGLVVLADGQARLAHWRGGVGDLAAFVDQLRRDGECSEVAAISTEAVSEAVLAAAGFRVRDRAWVYAWDPAGNAPGEWAMDWLDDDTVTLRVPGYPYWT